jgi:hypothetical protein
MFYFVKEEIRVFYYGFCEFHGWNYFSRIIETSSLLGEPNMTEQRLLIVFLCHATADDLCQEQCFKNLKV